MDEFLTKDASYNRLYLEYKKYGSLYGAFDFDGTIYDYHNTGKSYEQVKQLVRDLYSIGCKLDCWTAQNDHSLVATFLNREDIPFEGINTDGIELGWTSRKPFYSFILDDRSGLIQVYEDLTRLVNTIKNENK